MIFYALVMLEYLESDMIGQQEQNLFGENKPISDEAELLFKLVFNLPINWVGNKKRMLNRLLVFINENNIEHSSFFDVFSGSGVVSLLAAASNKKVISNDLLILSTTWIMQLLSSIRNPLSVDEAVELLRKTNEITGTPTQIGFLSKLYDGALLSQEELKYLDAYRRAVSIMFGPYMPIGKRLCDNSYKPAFINLNDKSVVFNCPISNPEKTSFAMQMMCIHILQQAFMGGRCYKSQLLSVSEKRLREGKVNLHGNSNAIGNENLLIKLLSPRTYPTKEITHFLSTKDFSADIFNCDAETLISSGSVASEVAYFDPPYGGYNSDYAWMYRVCEEFLTGVRLEDCRELRECSVKFKGNDYERDKSFAKQQRKGYTDNFSALLNVSKIFPYWLISFNESSFASIEDIVNIVSSFRQKIVVESVDGYRYNYREKSSKAGSEYIILARSN